MPSMHNAIFYGGSEADGFPKNANWAPRLDCGLLNSRHNLFVSCLYFAINQHFDIFKYKVS